MSSMAPFERAMVVSYVVLSVTIRPQFAIECLQRSNQQGGSLWAQISGCSPWSRSMMFGSAESERPTLTNVKLFSKNSNLCDHNPSTSQRDGQTTCDRKTALCTKVHRAVKPVTHNEQYSSRTILTFSYISSKLLSYFLPPLHTRLATFPSEISLAPITRPPCWI